MEDMMRHRIAMIAALLVLGGNGPARAFDRGPVCREPTVIDEMTREIRAQAYYAEVNPRLVTEQPTIDRRVVRCQVCVEMEPYDTMRLAGESVRQCEAHGFEVLILPAGFVVRDLR
jgi:hypothetical protein